MKYLKYLLLVILLLLIIFIAIGFITPSINYESEVTVNKPAKEVWAVMQDESKLDQWITGYKRSEVISGAAGTVGAVSNVYVEDQGQETVMQETITGLTPNKRMAMDFSIPDMMDMEYEMLLDEVDGKTVLTSKTLTTGAGLFTKPMIALMKGAMIKQEDINMNKLKTVIESNTTNYFPEPILEVQEVSEMEEVH